VVTGVKRVVIADHDGDARASISELVSSIGLVPEAVATGGEALAATERLEVALALLAVDLSGPCGYQVLCRMRDRYGERVPIALLSATAYPQARDEVASLLLGADDYFTKPLQGDEFLARVRRLVSRPARAISQRQSREGGGATGDPIRAALTNREHEVLALLVEGYSSSEISERLCITRKTGATHIERILPKLGAHSQAQAVAFALRDGVLDHQRPAPEREERGAQMAGGRRGPGPRIAARAVPASGSPGNVAPETSLVRRRSGVGVRP
jgi:DNA-binding NarL/FixJ family response regulator